MKLSKLAKVQKLLTRFKRCQPENLYRSIGHIEIPAHTLKDFF